MKYENKEAFEQVNMFGTGTPNTAYSKFFIGDAFLNPLTDPKGSLFAANVTFEPACRNNWHIHHATSGGGHINAGFLAAGLLDEVSILIGAGIDGRGGMQSVFDGLPMERGVTPLKLTSVQQYGSGAVWLRYNVEN